MTYRESPGGITKVRSEFTSARSQESRQIILYRALNNSLLSDWQNLIWKSSISLILDPNIPRRTPYTITLDSCVILSSQNSEISLLSPVRAPRISAIPKSNSILLSPTINHYMVIWHVVFRYLFENSTCIALKLRT